MPLSSAMLCPPAMKTLPSARRPSPAQKRLALLNDVVWKLLVFGSQIVAAVVLLLASWPQANTLPVASGSFSVPEPEILNQGLADFRVRDNPVRWRNIGGIS